MTVPLMATSLSWSVVVVLLARLVTLALEESDFGVAVTVYTGENVMIVRHKCLFLSAEKKNERSKNFLSKR